MGYYGSWHGGGGGGAGAGAVRCGSLHSLLWAIPTAPVVIITVIISHTLLLRLGACVAPPHQP